MVTSPTPDTESCLEKNYKHKSEAELAAMTPRQLVNEWVKVNPSSFDSYAAVADYESLIDKYIRKAGVKALPVLTEDMNSYDPKSASKCEEMRFHVASGRADGIDIGVIRLRGTKEGQSAIVALERAIERMKEAGFDKGEYNSHSNLYFALIYLRTQKGVNIRDDLILNTLRGQHGVQMNDDELLRFSDFLISLDPAYPTWSEVSENVSPGLVKDSKRYYEAYLKFKAKK